jgi:hypothetical protein
MSKRSYRLPSGLVPTPRPSRPGPVRRSAEACECVVCQAEARGESFSQESFFDRIARTVDEYGMFVQAVTVSIDRPAWAYTIGRVQRGLPELIVMGLLPKRAHELLTDLDRNWDAALAGEMDDRVQLLPLSQRAMRNADWVAGSIRFAADEGLIDRLTVMQAVWPDPEGRFPWQPSFTPSLRHSQRMLGLVPA